MDIKRTEDFKVYFERTKLNLETANELIKWHKEEFKQTEEPFHKEEVEKLLEVRKECQKILFALRPYVKVKGVNNG